MNIVIIINMLQLVKYKERMEQCIYNIVGYEIGKRIKLVLSNDGSGKGADLAVAAS